MVYNGGCNLEVVEAWTFLTLRKGQGDVHTESSIVVGHHAFTGYFVWRLVVIPTPPPPKSRVALNRIGNFCTLNRYARKALGVPHNHHRVAWGILLVHLGERNFERRAFVFLNSERYVATYLARCTNSECTRKPTGRQGKLCRQFAKGICNDLVFGYNLPIGIVKFKF